MHRSPGLGDVKVLADAWNPCLAYYCTIGGLLWSTRMRDTKARGCGADAVSLLS